MLYTVRLMSFRGDEILLIDMCMQMCSMDMKEAASCIDNMPAILAKNVDEDKANVFKTKFEELGAEIELISSEEEAGLEGSIDDIKNSEDAKKSEHIQYSDEVDDSGNVQEDYSNEAENEQYYQEEYVSQQHGYIEHDYVEHDYVEHDYEEHEHYYSEEEYENQDSAYNESEYYNNQEYSNEQYDGEYQNYEAYTNDSKQEYNETMYNNQGHEETNQNNVTEMSRAHDNSADVASGGQEDKEDFYLKAGCPKCGSAFVSKKVSTGLFGSKVKYVCEACKHKW